MREILFRGKWIRTGEWIEGTGIVYDGVNTWMLFNEPDTAIAFGLHHVIVDPASVGQCTEHMDENGKKIFEGDIFDWGYAGAYDMRYVVSYDADTASFIGVRKGGFLSLSGIAIKIIGNIHDNPELLEVSHG